MEPPSGIYAFKALYDHRPTDAKGLLLVKNEIVLGTSAVSTSNGWILCQKPRAPYTMGFVPASYVVIYPSAYAKTYLDPILQKIESDLTGSRSAVSWLLTKSTKAPSAAQQDSNDPASDQIDKQTLESPRTLWRRSVDLMCAGNYPGAIMVMKELESTFSGHPQLMFNMGMAHQRLSQFPIAIFYYTVALRLDPQMIVAQFSRAVCYQNERDYLQSLADYGVVLEQMGDSKTEISYRLQGLEFTLQKALVLFNKGVVLAALGRAEEALACVSLAISTHQTTTMNGSANTSFENVCAEMQRSLSAIVERKKANQINSRPTNLSPSRSPHALVPSRELLFTPTTAQLIPMNQRSLMMAAASRTAGATAPRIQLLNDASTAVSASPPPALSSMSMRTSTDGGNATIGRRGSTSSNSQRPAAPKNDMQSFLQGRIPATATATNSSNTSPVSSSPSSTPPLLASPIPRKPSATTVHSPGTNSPLRWATGQPEGFSSVTNTTTTSPMTVPGFGHASPSSLVASPRLSAVPKLLLNTIGPTVPWSSASTTSNRISPNTSPPASPSPPQQHSPNKISPPTSPRGQLQRPVVSPNSNVLDSASPRAPSDATPSPFPFHRTLRDSTIAVHKPEPSSSAVSTSSIVSANVNNLANATTTVLAQTLHKISKPVRAAAAGMKDHAREAAIEARLIVASVGAGSNSQQQQQQQLSTLDRTSQQQLSTYQQQPQHPQSSERPLTALELIAESSTPIGKPILDGTSQQQPAQSSERGVTALEFLSSSLSLAPSGSTVSLQPSQLQSLQQPPSSAANTGPNVNLPAPMPVSNSPILPRQKKGFVMGTHRPVPVYATPPSGTQSPDIGTVTPPPAIQTMKNPLPIDGPLGLPLPPLPPPPEPPTNAPEQPIPPIPSTSPNTSPPKQANIVTSNAITSSVSAPQQPLAGAQTQKKTRPAGPLPAVPKTAAAKVQDQPPPPRAEFLIRSSSRSPLILDSSREKLGLLRSAEQFAPPNAKPPPSPATSGPNSRAQSTTEVPDLIINDIPSEDSNNMATHNDHASASPPVANVAGMTATGLVDDRSSFFVIPILPPAGK